MAAAVLCMSIAPWTTLVMVPTNFELIRLGEAKGGARSDRSAKEKAASGKKTGESGDLALDSVSGKGQAGQFTDLSGPQGKTEQDTSNEEDKKVRDLLQKFGQMNTLRAVLIGAGGVLGLVTALA